MLGFFMKKNKPTEEELKLDKMWDAWIEGKVESPYAELMTYQSEINNGGHSQYFINVENCGDIEKEMSALNQLLSPELRSNLQEAYQAYLISEEKEEEAEEKLDQCDDVFYEKEEQIIHLLEDFSKRWNDKPN